MKNSPEEINKVLWRKAGGIDPRMPPLANLVLWKDMFSYYLAWLHGTTLNKIYDHIRKETK